MKSEFELLEKIRKRPGIYIGDATLDKVRVYLSGYLEALVDIGVNRKNWDKMQTFHEFVRAKLGFPESTPGWANMILEYVMSGVPEQFAWETLDKRATREDHRRSFDLFYELLDEFKNGS